MNDAKLILTQPVLPPTPLGPLGAALFSKPAAKLELGEISGFSEEAKRQVAKDFESVLLNKLLDEMKNTIGDWGFDEDAASEQIHGIFWLYLARHVANNGGFGLWKDIYRFLNNSNQANTAIESLDENI